MTKHSTQHSIHVNKQNKTKQNKIIRDQKQMEGRKVHRLDQSTEQEKRKISCKGDSYNETVGDL